MKQNVGQKRKRSENEALEICSRCYVRDQNVVVVYVVHPDGKVVENIEHGGRHRGKHHAKVKCVVHSGPLSDEEKKAWSSGYKQLQRSGELSALYERTTNP